MSLTDSELQQYHDLGYLIKPGILSAADMQPIKEAMNDLVDHEARRLHAEGLLDDLCEDGTFETRLARIYASNNEAGFAIYRAILGRGGGGFSGPALFEVIRHPALLACIT